MSEINKLVDTKHKEHKYDDIINFAHPVSRTHPQMSRHDRAAQFSPFAALTGYEVAVREKARLTDKRMELDENSKDLLDEKLRILQEQIANSPNIVINYFKPDEKKTGGAYVETFGSVKKIDEYERIIQMCDGEKILIDEIIDMDGELFIK